MARVVNVFTGDLVLVPGTPETDPLPPTANAIYVGLIHWQRGGVTLPDWAAAMRRDGPLVSLYPGNPRYAASAKFADGIVLIHATIEALANSRMHVVLTTGHQALPKEVGRLPENLSGISVF